MAICQPVRTFCMGGGVNPSFSLLRGMERNIFFRHVTFSLENLCLTTCVAIFVA